MRKAVWLVLAMLISVLPGRANPTMLTATVQEVVYTQSADTGLVTTRDDQPLPDAIIRIPALAYETRSDQGGRFALPSQPLQQPVIVHAEKPGYAPETAILDENFSSQGFRIQLQAGRQILILDNALHHLGDNSYSPVSAGAMRFRAQAEGPRYQLRFQVLPVSTKSGACLGIGSVLGLDTLDARQQGQSRFHGVSTPLVIRLNGQILSTVSRNGDGYRAWILPGTLKPGENHLELETGYQIGKPELDYDDMEWMLLTLEWGLMPNAAIGSLPNFNGEVYNKSR